MMPPENHTGEYQTAPQAGSRGPSTAPLYMGLLVPIVLFAFAVLSTSGAYSGPGSEVESGTWNAILIAVTIVAMLWILFVYIINRPAEPPPRRAPPPGGRPGPAPGRAMTFKVAEKGAGEPQAAGGADVKAPESGAGKEMKKEAAERARAEEKRTGAPEAKPEEERVERKEEKPAADLSAPSAPMAADDVKERLGPGAPGGAVSLINKRMLEYPPFDDKGIFCDTFIPVDEGAVLKYRYKVADDVYVRT